LLTAMTSMAQTAGANRILASGRIPHPVGDPTRSPEEEFAWRKDQLRKALEALSTPLDEGQIFS
jgi:glycine reductase